MRIELKHFGQHAALTIDSRTPVTLVVGANRCGKTTIRDALEFALLGTCALRGFTLKKDVARYMIHEAATRASVELRFEKWGVRRSVASSGAQQIQLDRHGNGGWVVVSAAEFDGWISKVWTPLAIRCALESDELWRDPEKRTALFVSLASEAAITAAQVWNELPGSLFKSSAGVDEGALNRICEVAASSGFAVANAQAVEKRREAKRKMQAAMDEGVAAVDPIIDGFDVRCTPWDSLCGAVRDSKAELARARESAAIDVGRLTERRDAARRQCEAKDAEWAEVSRRIWRDFAAEPWAEGEEIGPTETIPAGDFVEEAQKCAGSILALRESAEKNAREIEALTLSIGVEPSDEVDDLTPPPARCPAQPFAFACPAKLADVAAARAAARTERLAAWVAGGPEREEARRHIARFEEDTRQIERAIAEWTEKGDRLLARARERASLDELTLSLKREVDLARAKADAADAELAKAGTAATAEQVAMFAEMVERAERQLARREAFDAAAEDSERIARAREAFEAEVEWWDGIEHALRPEGIEAKLAREGTTQLMKDLAAAEPFFGVVDIDANFDISIAGRHIAAASKSEQRCAGIALQFAIARAIDFPVIVVDELDALDAHWRGRFADFAQGQIPDSGVSLVALATTSREPSRPPAGYTTALLRPGRVEMIEGGES